MRVGSKQALVIEMLSKKQSATLDAHGVQVAAARWYRARAVQAVGRILPTPILGGLHHQYLRI
jgi:hypothetical protein